MLETAYTLSGGALSTKHVGFFPSTSSVAK
jgi:hypothetical protein